MVCVGIALTASVIATQVRMTQALEEQQAFVRELVKRERHTSAMSNAYENIYREYFDRYGKERKVVEQQKEVIACLTKDLISAQNELRELKKAEAGE